MSGLLLASAILIRSTRLPPHPNGPLTPAELIHFNINQKPVDSLSEYARILHVEVRL